MLPISNIITTLLGKSQTTGDNPFGVTCSDGQVVTGISMNSGSKIDRINSITCKPLGKIQDSSFSGMKKSIFSGGNGGTRYDLECPANQAIGSIYTGYDDLLDYAEVSCADIKTKEVGQKQVYGVMRDFNTKKTVPGQIIGMKGRTGRYVDNVNIQSKNFSSIMQYLESPEGRLACCMKTIPADYCKFWGTSAGCDSFMNSFCADPANAKRGECACINSLEQTGIPCPFKFNTKCINSGYQTSNMRTMVCPDFLQCNQINNLSDSAKVFATRLEQNCTVNNTTNNTLPTPTPTNTSNTPTNASNTPTTSTSDSTGFIPPGTTPSYPENSTSPGTTTNSYPVKSNASGSSVPLYSAPNTSKGFTSSNIMLLAFVLFITISAIIGLYIISKPKPNNTTPINYQNQQQGYQQQGY